MVSLDDVKTAIAVIKKHCDSLDPGLIQRYRRAAIRAGTMGMRLQGGRSIEKGGRFVKKKGSYPCSFSSTHAILCPSDFTS